MSIMNPDRSDTSGNSNTAGKAGTLLSFEFFPPNTPEGVAKLRLTRQVLSELKPEFFSVTYGAGGSTQEKTVGIITEIAAEGLQVAPHLSCIGATRTGIAELLDRYRAQGIRRLVALRGDLPSGMVDRGEFRYASDLVAFIREHGGDWFHIEVAAYPETHPQAASPDHDLDNFIRKVEAGADTAITQYFYNANAYFDFVDRARARGVTIPIVPGIMPITNYTQLARFSDNCGAEIPRWVRLRLAAYHDDLASLRAFGHDVVTALCQTLVDSGVPGIHFYTLNQAGPSAGIWKSLRR
jgi:methylenetetrahydrofolate reductase (NADPH)